MILHHTYLFPCGCEHDVTITVGIRGVYIKEAEITSIINDDTGDEINEGVISGETIQRWQNEAIEKEEEK